jgi:hypothetical protein
VSESGSASVAYLASLLATLDVDDAADALQQLPVALQERLTELSPLTSLENIQAPLIVVCHDRSDLVIPIGESRRLCTALSGRPGVHYTEFSMFEHMDPTKRHLPLGRMAWELGKFYRALYPVFRSAQRGASRP